MTKYFFLWIFHILKFIGYNLKMLFICLVLSPFFLGALSHRYLENGYFFTFYFFITLFLIPLYFYYSYILVFLYISGALLGLLCVFNCFEPLDKFTLKKQIAEKEKSKSEVGVLKF